MNSLNKGNECLAHWAVRKMAWTFLTCTNMSTWGKCSVDFRVHANLASPIITLWVIGEINPLPAGNNSITHRAGWFSLCTITTVNKVPTWCEESISFFRGTIGALWNPVVSKHRVTVFMNFFIVKIVCLTPCMFHIQVKKLTWWHLGEPLGWQSPTWSGKQIMVENWLSNFTRVEE